jgi:TPR repeat protein
MRHRTLIWLAAFLSCAGLAPSLPTSVPSATAPLSSVADAALSPALETYRKWWYQCAPPPGAPEQAAIRRATEQEPVNGEALLWRSREVRRLVDVDTADPADPAVREREALADRLAQRAADLNVDAARVDVATSLLRDSSRGGEPEREAARQRIIELAERRQLDALLVLGVMHREAVGGIPADLTRAERLLRVAAMDGNARANRELAVVLLTQGRADEALAVLRRGSEAGDTRAQYELSNALRFGKQVARPDPKEGEMWLRRSAQGGFRRAQVELAQLLLNDHRHDEWPEALRLLEGASTESDGAKLMLAHICLYGTYRQHIDLDRAVKLLRELAEKGNREACLTLGEAYLTGLWLPKDPPAGVRLLKVAAEAGDLRAQNLLRLYNYVLEHPSSPRQR